MCKWMDKVVDGVEVYQVGKQQLWDWCSYNGREFTGWLPEHQTVYSFADSLRKGIYLVVEIQAGFGRVGDVQLAQSYTSLKSAVHYARLFGDVMFERVLDGLSGFAHEYQVWHVVDDAELWQEWDNASAAYVAIHQPEAPQMQPVVVDEERIRYGWDKICSVYVPFAGQNISFLVRERKEYGCYVRSEYVSADYVNGFYPVEQPMTVDDAYYYKWYSVYDLVPMWYEQLDTLDSLRQLREAGAIA